MSDRIIDGKSLNDICGVDTGVITEAFKRYAVSKDKNIPLLSEYAKKFHVEEKAKEICTRMEYHWNSDANHDTF